MSDIAIAHGRLTSDGGAERVALELARCFDAPIYAAEVDQSFVPADVEAEEVFNGRWSRLVSTDVPLVPDSLQWAGKHLYEAQRGSWVPELHDYGTVIVNKADLAWYVPRADQTVVRYLHTTPRRDYDLFYRRGASAVTRCWTAMMRALKQPRERYPDLIVCNSDVVRRRAERYWRVDDQRLRTVYPPVDVSQAPETDIERDILLYVGRLAQNKRIGLLRDLAATIQQEVVVAGDGPEADKLADGPDNLTHLGYVDESRKWRLMAQADATLMLARDEDFGITPVESMAAGTPVIGVEEGMTQYQIQDGNNGYLASDPTVDGVHRALQAYRRHGIAWSQDELRTFAAQFGPGRFREEIRAVVSEARDRTEIEPALVDPDQVQDRDRERVLADGGTDGD